MAEACPSTSLENVFPGDLHTVGDLPQRHSGGSIYLEDHRSLQRVTFNVSDHFAFNSLFVFEQDPEGYVMPVVQHIIRLLVGHHRGNQVTIQGHLGTWFVRLRLLQLQQQQDGAEAVGPGRPPGPRRPSGTSGQVGLRQYGRTGIETGQQDWD